MALSTISWSRLHPVRDRHRIEPARSRQPTQDTGPTAWSLPPERTKELDQGRGRVDSGWSSWTEWPTGPEDRQSPRGAGRHAACSLRLWRALRQRTALPAQRGQERGLVKTHRRSGHRPPKGHGEGSNGVPTPCEALLLAALPAEAGWVLHHRVPRPDGLSQGYLTGGCSLPPGQEIPGTSGSLLGRPVGGSGATALAPG